MPEAGLSFGTTLAYVSQRLMGSRKLRNLKVAATRPNVPYLNPDELVWNQMRNTYDYYCISKFYVYKNKQQIQSSFTTSTS